MLPMPWVDPLRLIPAGSMAEFQRSGNARWYSYDGRFNFTWGPGSHMKTYSAFSDGETFETSYRIKEEKLGAWPAPSMGVTDDTWVGSLALGSFKASVPPGSADDGSRSRTDGDYGYQVRVCGPRGCVPYGTPQATVRICKNYRWSPLPSEVCGNVKKFTQRNDCTGETRVRQGTKTTGTCKCPGGPQAWEGGVSGLRCEGSTRACEGERCNLPISEPAWRGSTRTIISAWRGLLSGSATFRCGNDGRWALQPGADCVYNRCGYLWTYSVSHSPPYFTCLSSGRRCVGGNVTWEVNGVRCSAYAPPVPLGGSPAFIVAVRDESGPTTGRASVSCGKNGDWVLYPSAGTTCVSR